MAYLEKGGDYIGGSLHTASLGVKVKIWRDGRRTWSRFFSTVVLVTSAWTDTTSKSVCVWERERAAESEGCFRILTCVCVFLFGAPCSLELQRPRIFSLDLFFFFAKHFVVVDFHFLTVDVFPRERRKKKLPASQLRPALQSIRQLSDSVSCTHSCQVRKLLSLYFFYFSAAWILSLQKKRKKNRNTNMESQR